MEENKTEDITKPIEDIKPQIPDAASTGAEFSEYLGPQPYPPKELSGVKKETARPNSGEQPVTPPPKKSEEATMSVKETAAHTPVQKSSNTPQSKTSNTDASQQPINSPSKTVVDQTPAPANTKDHGTHRSVPKKSKPGLALFIVFVGLSLCGFVVYAYSVTN